MVTKESISNLVWDTMSMNIKCWYDIVFVNNMILVVDKIHVNTNNNTISVYYHDHMTNTDILVGTNIPIGIIYRIEVKQY